MSQPNNDVSRSALAGLTTETANPALSSLDEMTVIERLRLMNAEDQIATVSVAQEIEHIAAAIELVVRSFQSGGRLIYVGAGTSGRLGVLDASECPPTFGTNPELVTALIAGGRPAMFEAIEGAEDDEDEGRRSIVAEKITAADTVVGISASGQAPFVLGALSAAKQAGAATVAVVNNRETKMHGAADVVIAVVVGPELIAGSTRLKAGTAQKLVLNMLTTNAMVEIGKTYGNHMVDVRVTNSKLKVRALRMTMEIAGADKQSAEAALTAAAGSAKLAILMLKAGLDAEDAKKLLIKSGGFLRKALEAFGAKARADN